jgi:hypothetical protein
MLKMLDVLSVLSLSQYAAEDSPTYCEDDDDDDDHHHHQFIFPFCCYALKAALVSTALQSMGFMVLAA